MAETDRTTVSMPADLHREVFGEDGLKPHSTMANHEFIEEMADTYRQVREL
jgi:hypothetical protein